MYQLAHYSYCGMRLPLINDADRTEARQEAAARIRKMRRRGYPVVTLNRGTKWEVMEPEALFGLVPDECGILALAHVTHSCRECGYAYETRDDAAACCQEELY